MALVIPTPLEQLKQENFCQVLTDGSYHFTPHTAEQVARLLHAAQQAEKPVHLSLQEVQGHAGELWLDLCKLEAIRHHRVADFVITVESGITMGTLQDVLKPHGQTFPLHYAPQTTLAQVLAEDRPSLETGFRGYPRDLVLGLEIATPDGQVTHCGGEVVKNVTGYDLNKLYVGSHQTLGVVTAATLKLMALAENTRGWLFEFQSIQKAFESVAQLLSSDLPLSRCELFHQDRLKDRLYAAASQHGVASWQLLLEITGDSNVLKQTTPLVRERVVYPDAESSLHPAREEELLQTLAVWPPDGFVLELALPKASLETLYLEVQLLGQTHGLQPLCQLRPAAGLLYLLWPRLEGINASILSDFLEALQAKVIHKGGILQVLQVPFPPSLEAISWMARYNLPADPLVKSLMERLKSSYDPKGILFKARLPLGTREGF